MFDFQMKTPHCTIRLLLLRRLFWNEFLSFTSGPQEADDLALTCPLCALRRAPHRTPPPWPMPMQTWIRAFILAYQSKGGGLFLATPMAWIFPLELHHSADSFLQHSSYTIARLPEPNKQIGDCICSPGNISILVFQTWISQGHWNELTLTLPASYHSCARFMCLLPSTWEKTCVPNQALLMNFLLNTLPVTVSGQLKLSGFWKWKWPVVCYEVLWCMK